MDTPNYKYASFFQRVAAQIIDTLILNVILAPIIILFFGQINFTEEQINQYEQYLQLGDIQGLQSLLLQQITPAQIIVEFAIAIIFFAALWHLFGGTPGKRWLGLRVIDAKTGNNLTISQSTLRSFGLILSFILTSGLIYLWMCFDKQHQTLHDKLAGSFVIIETKKLNSNPKTQITSDKKDDIFTA